MKDHLRFAVCYWHTFRGMGGDPFGPGCAVRPWEDGTDSVEMAPSASASPSSSWRSSASRSTASTTATSPPRARTSPRRTRTSTRSSRSLKKQQGHRHQAALGHGEPLQQPALRARRGHQLQRRRVRLRRRAGEEGAGGDQGTRRRELRLLGRPRRLPQPLQHRPRRELDHLAKFLHLAVEYKKKIGFTGPVPDRAEAEGADHAPVRLRRRRVPGLPAPTAWTRTSS